MSERVVFITGSKGADWDPSSPSASWPPAAKSGWGLTQHSLSKISRCLISQRWPVDFTKAATVTSAVNSVADRYGQGSDVLVHVVGSVCWRQNRSPKPMTPTWEQMRDLNLTSAFYTLRAAIPHLRKSGTGRIVAIGKPHPRFEPHAGTRGLRLPSRPLWPC